MPPQKKSGEIRHFFTKVAGVTHKNADGSSRQRILRKCSVGESLMLVPEPDNPHDTNAIRLCRQNGQQLGYVNRDLAAEIASKRRGLERHAMFVSQITGADSGKSLGANVLVICKEPDTPDREIRRYVGSVLKAEWGKRKAEDGAGCLVLAMLFLILWTLLSR